MQRFRKSIFVLQFMRAYSPLLVVLVGLATACASGRTGSREPRPSPPSTTVTAEDIERSPSMPLEELVASRFPGVWLSRTADGGLAVRIRGTTTIVGSKEPLYILDGTPILPGPNGGLAGLVPGDIESIEVVKDVAGMAMYGLQGANGIIVIKTKRPPQ